MWSHDGVSTSALAAAKVQVEAFPRVSDEGTKLAEQAALVIGLREALLTCDWAQAASWAGLVHLLDGIEGEGAALDEVSAAWQEVADKRAGTHEDVRVAMRDGRSQRSSGGGWDHTGVASERLEKAASEAEAMPKQTVEGTNLAAAARTCVAVRRALLQAVPGEGQTWEELAHVLGQITSPEQLGLSEVRAAWQELKDARVAIEEALRAKMRDGRSQRRSGGGGNTPAMWDHSSLDVEGLRRVLCELNNFPAVENAASRRASRRLSGSGGNDSLRDDEAAGGDELTIGGSLSEPLSRSGSSFAQARESRRSSVGERPAMLNRASMVRLTQASAELSEVADFLLQLREALLAEAWADVSELLQKAADFPVQDEMGNEEVQLAAQELHDTALASEALCLEAMEQGRSRRGAGGAGWDHSQLEVTKLASALEQLAAFPVPRPSAAGVLARGKIILALRTALQAEAWGEVQVLLQEPTVASDDEVLSAAKELEDASKAVLDEVRAALQTGTSVKEYGKATVTNFGSTKKVTPVVWNRSGLSTERLGAAVAKAKAFPADTLPAEVATLYEHAAAASSARELLKANDWAGLRAFLSELKPELAREMNELKMAWQEYLTNALEAAAKSKDQEELKQLLKQATEHGMLATERPVWKALEVFVDPPTIIYQPPAQVRRPRTPRPPYPVLLVHSTDRDPHPPQRCCRCTRSRAGKSCCASTSALPRRSRGTRTASCSRRGPMAGESLACTPIRSSSRSCCRAIRAPR